MEHLKTPILMDFKLKYHENSIFMGKVILTLICPRLGQRYLDLLDPAGIIQVGIVKSFSLNLACSGLNIR